VGQSAGTLFETGPGGEMMEYTVVQVILWELAVLLGVFILVALDELSKD